MEKDMECLPPKLVKRFCSAASCVISTFQPAFLRLRKKHLCEDMNVTLQTSMFTWERRNEDRVAPLVLRNMQGPHWQQQRCLSDMIPLSINHFIKTCTPQYRVCPDHSILLIQGEAPVILWPKVPAIVLYLLYGMLVLTPLPPM